MSEYPTLKVRFEMLRSTLGADCYQIAKQIEDADGTVRVLDSKWGREPSVWSETGGGWGRLRLTDWQRGYVAACEATVGEHSVERQLLDIIKGIAS